MHFSCHQTQAIYPARAVAAVLCLSAGLKQTWSGADITEEDTVWFRHSAMTSMWEQVVSCNQHIIGWESGEKLFVGCSSIHWPCRLNVCNDSCGADVCTRWPSPRGPEFILMSLKLYKKTTPYITKKKPCSVWNTLIFFNDLINVLLENTMPFMNQASYWLNK